MKELLKIKREFDRWFCKYNSTYKGGGGGVGSFTDSNTIYHQAYNGDNNYHERPKEASSIYYEVLKEMSPEIYKKVADRINKKIVEKKDDEIKRLEDMIKQLQEIN
jgi:hypothetical protein